MKDGTQSGSPPSDTSIATTAYTRAEGLLLDHLHENPITPGATATGGVIVITGPLGSGKTHLAWMLAERCRAFARSAERPIRPVYLDLAVITAESFYGLCVDGLSQAEVTSCVREYHTDLVGRQITDESLGKRVTETLRLAGLTARQRAETIERFGLSEATLLVQLQNWLEEMVGDRLYATAFTFLLRDGLDQAAWSWLRGNPPAAILLERGFQERDAATDNAADLVPFAQLYEHQQYRLVLILDNVDQLRFHRDPERRLRTFGKTIDQLRDAGALVFLLSTEDAARGLGLGRSRQGLAHIDMPLWDADTVERFVRKWSSDGGLAPFHRDALALIADFTGGQPALVSSLVTRLRADAEQTGTEVSIDVVRSVATEFFARIDRADLIAATSRALDSRSWYYRTDHNVNVREGSHTRVDFWIPSDGPGQSGCVLVVVDVPVDAGTVERLTSMAATLRSAKARITALVLVTGEVSRPHADTIERSFGREPLIYAPETFDADLESAVKAMRHLLAESAGDALAAISERVDALDGQQTLVLRAIEDVLAAVDELRPGSGESQQSPGRDSARLKPSALPPAAVTAFERVRTAVADLGSPDAVGSGLFTVDTATQDRAEATLRRFANPTNDMMPAVGAARAVFVVVDAFQAAIESWYREARHTTAELNRLCDRYAALVQALPLDELLGLTSLPPARRDAVNRYEAARRRIEVLADEVRSTMRG